MESNKSKLEIQLADALSKIARLEEENSKLKNLLGVSENNPASAALEVSGINNHSKPEAKVALFRSLFKGREDVFAKRWTGKNNKSGYSPVCVNDWVPEKCGKFTHIPCAKCKNRQLIPISDEQYINHLSGKFVAGIYPLLDNESCNFLALDFDKKNWQEDVKAFIKTCHKFDVPASIERSRSGNGAHIWVFFESEIPAALARKLGFVLLTATMEIHHQIGLDSYDRLFPNQDRMPKGGFGNLIALPLQKKSREAGNSVFLDDNLIPYKDQWFYLDQVLRIAESKVQNIVDSLLQCNSLVGKLRDTSEEDVLTWDKKIEQIDEIEIMPTTLNLTFSNMIFISKEGLPNKLLNRIVRIAAFQNPEFYKAQALRMSVHDIPRIINLSSENTRYIAIPRGCKEELFKLCDQTNITPEINDMTNHGIIQNFSFAGKLRDEQLEAGHAMLEHDNGILSASPAFGKTVVALWIIAQKNINTLIIVHRRQLLEQWKVQISCFLKIPLKEIGEIGAGKDKHNLKLDVALIQSLNHNRQVKDFVQDYGLVIVDECHHISAYSFEQVLKKVKAKYVYGLTATLTRKDGHHPIVTMQCGPVRYKMPNRVQLQNMNFFHYVIVRYTNFSLPYHLLSSETKITELYQALIDDDARNNLILDDIISAIVAGRSPLILTERTAHVDFFAEKLNGFAKYIIVLKGGMGKKQIKAIMEKLKSIPEQEERIIIATGKYIGEGFDDSRLDTLFLTLPISWKGTLQQYAGRLHRSHSSKTEVIIYDYVDNQTAIFAAMYKKRAKGYGWMGYQIKKGMDKCNVNEC